MAVKSGEYSIKQLFRIAFPLLFSSLSAMGMIFVDRLILATHSLDAHNAAVEATNFGWVFLTGWSTLSSVSQIFVAQNYGAQKYSNLGRPVWQMIWLGVCSCLFFIPASLWMPGILFGNESSYQMHRIYLSWMLISGPCQILFYALCGFFIGQGKTLLTSIAVLIGNFVNAGLCYLLVFGWEGYVTPMGSTGAAIATNTAVLGQVLLLLIVFFNSSNRKLLGTTEWSLRPELLKDCIRVGLPSALFAILEVAGWVLFYKMMSSLGPKHLTVAGIVQNILILFNFFGDSLYKSVATLCGNAIGAKRQEDVFKIVRSGFVLMTIFMICFALFIWATHSVLIHLFLNTMSPGEFALIESALMFGLANAVIYKYFEGIRLIFSGALTAAADTVFLLVGGSCSVWLFMVLPIYTLVVKQEGSIETALILCSLYTLLAALVYGWRFYSRAWQKHAILITSSSH